MSSFLEMLASHRAHQGRKLDAVSTGRLAEASRLTDLLRTPNGFSFVRLGDYDLGFLLNPTVAMKSFDNATKQISGTRGFGTPGLNANQVIRLRRALERASYVDFWDRQWKDSTLLEQLKLQRRPNALRNPNPETSCILPTWLEYEFQRYCQDRRVLFCGAEASLLEELLKQPEFRQAAKDFWPELGDFFFLRPREDGRNLGANLDVIKGDLQAIIRQFKINTLFLSLGGGAKILCVELAEELGVCAIDFGALMRSLTYSGSDGNQATRSTHHVFLYRVPFGLYMDALVQAYPGMPPEVLLAKAHAQLLLEVQEKEVGWSHSAWEYEFSAENVAHFQESFDQYQHRFSHLYNHSAATRKERADFLHFCGTHKLTLEGRSFLWLFKVKNWIKTIKSRTANILTFKNAELFA
jgi:hypothetical protein